jgi:restriction system protein
MNKPKVRKDDFYLQTHQVLHELGGSGSIQEIEDKLIERFGFTSEDLDPTFEISGAHIITHKMAWARSYLKIASHSWPAGAGPG